MERVWLFLRAASLAVALGWAAAASHGAALEVSGRLSGVPLGPFVAVGSDRSGTWTVETLRAQPDKLADWHREDLNLGITSAATWVRLQVSNASSDFVTWYLDLGDGLIEEVTLFEELPNGQIGSRTAGVSHPWASRDVPHSQVVFALRESPGSHRTLYLKVVTGLGKRLLMRAYSPDLFPRATQLRSVVWGGLLGVYAGVGAYHFVLFLLLKDAAYFWHAALMAAALASRALLHSFGLESLWPQGLAGYGSLNLVLTSLIFVCALMFALKVLPWQSLHAGWRLVVSWLRWCWLALLVWSVLWPGAAAAMALTLLGLPTQVVILFAALASWRTGSPVARWFLPAWVLLIAGGLVWSGRNLGWVPLNDWTLVAGSLGLVMHTLLLSAGLAMRVRESQRERLHIQAELAEERRLANEKLEQRVRDRTAELRASRDQAEAANATKDLVVRLVSHDLRTPLASIVAGSERLSHVPSTAAGIRQTAQGMIRLIDRLLNLDYLSTGALRPRRAWVPVRTLVQRQIDPLGSLMQAKGLQLRNEVPEEVRWFVDPVLMGEVVANLLSNSVKACQADGVVRVSCPEEASGLVVQDDGPGFDRTPEASRGSGLGLQYCREILKLHGAQLLMDQVDSGASVRFLLPPPGLRVVLLGADPGLAAELEGPLARQWPTCTVRSVAGFVDDPSHVVEALRDEQPDLVVLDLSAHSAPRLEAVHRLRQSGPTAELPLLVLWPAMSLEESRRMERECMAAGADAFLVKPLDPELLTAAAVSLLSVEAFDD